MSPYPIARSTIYKQELPVFDDAINTFASKIALMYTLQARKSLPVVITSSDDVMYQQAKKNSGALKFPMLGIRLESAEIDFSHRNPRILYRSGISLKDMEGSSYKVFHLMPIKLQLNVKFFCRTPTDRNHFMKGWLFNLIEDYVSFDFLDESVQKTFQMRMRVETDMSVQAGVFDKDTDLGTVNTMETTVTLHTYAGKFGRVKAIDAIKLDFQIGSLGDGGYFVLTSPISFTDGVTVVDHQGFTPPTTVINITQAVASQAPIPIEIGTGFIEEPLANETLLLYTPTSEITLDHNLCISRTLTPSTAEVVFTIYKNNIDIGTFTFQPGDTESTLYLSPILAYRKLSAGDFLEIKSPVTVDDTIAQITFTLGGFKVANPSLPTTVEICTGIVERPLGDEVLLIYSPVKTVVLEQTLSLCKARIPATALTVFSIRKNDIEIGTVEFGPGQTDGVLILNASSVVRRLLITDFLTIKAPAIEDSTIANITFTLVGYK